MNETINGYSTRATAARGRLAVMDAASPERTACRVTPAIKGSADTGRMTLEQWRRKATSLGKASRRSVAQIVQTLQLPALFNGVRSEIRQAMADFKSSPDDLCELVYQDPVLATAVFAGMSRCAGPREMKRTDTIRRVTLERIMMQIEEAEMDAPPLTALTRPLVMQWWCHATLVSQFAAALAGSMEVDRQLARAAGFFHDVGRLVLLCSPVGEKLFDVCQSMPRMAFPVAAAETALLGMSRHEAGALWCRRWNLPSIFEKVCLAHDQETCGATTPLAPNERRLIELVAAANDMAKGAGMGSFADDRLRSLDPQIGRLATELDASLSHALAQAQTLCLWRVGHDGTTLLPADSRLADALIIHVTDDSGPWNPVGRLLKRAGADVIACPDLKQLIERCTMGDAMVIDMTRRSLHLHMPMLIRLAQTPCFADMPKLLLAGAEESPASRVKQAKIDMAVHTTPIRTQGLLQAVGQLLG